MPDFTIFDEGSLQFAYENSNDSANVVHQADEVRSGSQFFPEKNATDKITGFNEIFTIGDGNFFLLGVRRKTLFLSGEYRSIV